MTPPDPLLTANIRRRQTSLRPGTARARQGSTVRYRTAEDQIPAEDVETKRAQIAAWVVDSHRG